MTPEEIETKRLALAEPDAGSAVLSHFWQSSSPHFNGLVELVKETIGQWVEDKAPRLAASLAFYTLLSLAPLLIVVVAVAALVYGQEASRGQLVWQIRKFVGPEGAEVIQGLIQGAYKPGNGIVESLIGLVTLTFGASTVVVELRDALNTIWHVAPNPRDTRLENIFRLAKERCYSLGLILGAGFLLLVSLVLNAGIAAMGRFFGSSLPTSEGVLHAATFFLSFFVVTLLFAAIYKLVPDVRLRWGDVFIGASVTSLLFTIGKQLISLYLGKATFSSAYGAAGSLVIVLVWVHCSAMLFFLGAEFTKVYTKTFGSQLPNKFQPAPPTRDSIAVNPPTGLIATIGNNIEGNL